MPLSRLAEASTRKVASATARGSRPAGQGIWYSKNPLPAPSSLRSPSTVHCLSDQWPSCPAAAGTRAPRPLGKDGGKVARGGGPPGSPEPHPEHGDRRLAGHGDLERGQPPHQPGSILHAPRRRPVTPLLAQRVPPAELGVA